jgi:hypothetical protein
VSARTSGNLCCVGLPVKVRESSEFFWRGSNPEQARELTVLPRSARIPLGGGDDEVLGERSACLVISTHLPPPVITESTADLAATSHRLVGIFFDPNTFDLLDSRH